MKTLDNVQAEIDRVNFELTKLETYREKLCEIRNRIDEITPNVTAGNKTLQGPPSFDLEKRLQEEFRAYGYILEDGTKIQAGFDPKFFQNPNVKLG